MSELATHAAMDAIGDLSSRVDVHDLVVEFYREVVFDDVLEPLFGETAEVDWALHIPKLIDYWCRILLSEDSFAGPLMAVHRHVHSLQPIQVEHCDQWYRLWAQSVDARWAGPVADHAKAHAASTMTGMARHIFGSEWSPPH